MSAIETVLLGAIAGLTIFLGLPVARLRSIDARFKAFLNSIACGILLFLLWDVLSHALEPIESSLKAAVDDRASWSPFATEALVFAVGLGIGLLSLVYYDQWLAARRAAVRQGPGTASASEFEARRAVGLSDPQALALFIASGIGLHNFSEGLAIGQSASAGELSLAYALIIGFGLHNATEGFGIVAPLAGDSRVPTWPFLLALGLVGGGPTFLGTLVGRTWVNDHVSIAFLALAAGSILFVINELFHLGQTFAGKKLLLWGVLFGLLAGIASDWVIEAAGG